MEQETQNLIEQARQVLPPEATNVQVEDQATLDAQASQRNSADELQGLLGKLSALTGESDPAAALAKVKELANSDTKEATGKREA